MYVLGISFFTNIVVSVKVNLNVFMMFMYKNETSPKDEVLHGIFRLCKLCGEMRSTT